MKLENVLTSAPRRSKTIPTRKFLSGPSESSILHVEGFPSAQQLKGICRDNGTAKNKEHVLAY